MQRYPAFDPPEYLAWSPAPDEVRRYRERLTLDAERAAVVRRLDEAALLALHAGLLRNRLHDLVLKRWVRTGVISKAWLGTGEEAATIGPVHALRRGGSAPDVVAPMIRNAGALHEMGIPLVELFHGALATAASPNGGRDGHLGSLRHGVVPPISHVGDMVPVAAGVALAFRQRGEPRVALTWVGDGTTRSAAFHEGLNLAAVQRLGVVFILQNNQVALGTRLEQHGAGSFAHWPRMYGVPGALLDGNHVLEMYAATALAAERARAGAGVSLLVAETFRMGGHATHDEREARQTFAPELFQHWGRRDPIGLYEAWLLEQGFAPQRLGALEAQVTAEVEAAAQAALDARAERLPDPASAATRVYATAPP